MLVNEKDEMKRKKQQKSLETSNAQFANHAKKRLMIPSTPSPLFPISSFP